MKNIFIVSFSPNWTGIARLPKALKHEGFIVITLSCQHSYLAKSLYSDFKYTYSNYWEIRKKIQEILKKHEIDFIIPGCDSAISYFSQIIQEKRWQLKKMKKFREVISKSCNNAEAYNLLTNKSSLQEMAVKYNILNPRNKHFNSVNEIWKEAKTREYPLVLKKDFGVAGKGVKICHNEKDVQEALKILNSKHFDSTIRYKITSFIGNLLSKPYNFRNTGISVQDYIEGNPCMHLVFASEGEILSSVTMLKVTCYPTKTSPSSVVQAIRHDQISAGTAKIIKENNVSGYFSFDYVIDKNNDAYLLECNPRPTPVTHLSHLCGGNLCAILKKHFKIDHDHLEPYPDIVHEYIALFPNELKRDPNSEYLTKGYHDIPVDDHLLLEMINSDLQKSGIQPVS